MSIWKQDVVEILGAFKEESAFGGEVLLHLNGEQLRVGFNVSERAYMLLKKLATFQPFESVAAGKYHYFFAGSYRQIGENTVMAGIQVVQDRRHKKFEIELTKSLLANLQWLQDISSKEQVEHLLRVSG
jgi:hypothetical protein